MAYDAVVIGAGHNGLVAAAYLARAGRKALVLERRDVIGGACVTEEVWPGYRVSTAAYLCSLLHPRIIEELELRRFGLEIYRRETSGFAPFPDGSYLLIHADSAETRRELERFCAGDVDAYFEFERDIETAADVLEPYFFQQSPSLGAIADAFAAAGIPGLFEPLFVGSVRDLLDARFKDERLKAVLATDGLIGTCAGPSDPGTAYVLLHHYMGRALGARGLWGYVRGGMGSITRAVADYGRSRGLEIRCSSEVCSVIMQQGRAAGVCLDSGEEIRANMVLSNADPIETYAMSRGNLPEEILFAAARWRNKGVSCKINMAVCELPDFTALPGREPGPQHLGTVHFSPSMEFLELAWQDASGGRPSAQPMVEMYIQTATDSSLAPSGKHILSCFTQYFPYDLADGLENVVEGERYYRRVLDVISLYAPNVPASVEAYQVLTPRDLETRFGLTGGHIFHGDITPDQMFGGRFGSTGPETCIPGLYLCGSGAFPGGCVSGVPGFNAARRAMEMGN